MLSLDEISKITLPAKLVHQHAEAPYFKREINQLNGKIRSENGTMVNFFIRYRVTANDPNLYRWSQVEKVVDIKDIPKKQFSSNSSSAFGPSSISDSLSAPPSNSFLSPSFPAHGGDGNLPDTLSSPARPARDSLTWLNKRFFVAFQVVGEPRPVLLNRLSNKAPTTAEVLQFCERERRERPQLVRRPLESLDSSFLSCSPEGAAPNYMELPPEAYLPTSAQVQELFNYRTKVLEPLSKWTTEDVEEHRRRQEPYAAAAAATAPLQRTILEGQNRQFLAQLQEAQQVGTQRMSSRIQGRQEVPPFSLSRSFSSFPSGVMMKEEGGVGPATTTPGAAIGGAANGNDVDGSENAMVLELHKETTEEVEGRESSFNPLYPSPSTHTQDPDTIASFPPTSMERTSVFSSVSGQEVLLHSPVPHSPFLPKNRKRPRPSLEPVFTGVPPSSSSPLQSSQGLQSQDTRSVPAPSLASSFPVTSMWPPSQGERVNRDGLSSPETLAVMPHQRDALQVLASLSHPQSPGVPFPLPSAGTHPALPFFSSSPSSQESGTFSSMGTAHESGYPTTAALGAHGPPRRTTSILEGSGMAMAEAAAASWHCSPLEAPPDEMGYPLSHTDMGTTSLRTASGLAVGSTPAGVGWMQRVALGSTSSPLLPYGVGGSGENRMEGIGSRIEARLTPEFMKMSEAAAVNEALFFSYVSNLERDRSSLKVSALTQSNQIHNRKQALLGLENQSRLKRSGNLLESAGLWVTDDGKRAEMAYRYTSRTAADSTTTSTSTSAPPATNAANNSSANSKREGAGGEGGNARSAGSAGDKGSDLRKPTKKGVEMEDPEVREFKEHHAAHLLSFGSIPSSLFDQLVASAEGIALPSPGIASSSTTFPSEGAASPVEAVCVRDHPFRLITSPSSLPLTGSAASPRVPSSFEEERHPNGGDGQREEADRHSGTTTSTEISSPFSPFHIRSQLIHRSAVVNAACTSPSEDTHDPHRKRSSSSSSGFGATGRETSPLPQRVPLSSRSGVLNAELTRK